MAEPRYRYSGRRSPQFNPARASMPVSIGYNPHYSGDLHTVQTARYDAAVPRRATDHKAPSNPTATITTYNVTKEPAAAAQRTSNSNTSRRRSSTVDTNPVKPIIVTTNHASRPHGTSSHTSSAARTTSPSRDPYRSSDETYYTQPASSIRSRSTARYGHGYSQSATLSNEEFSRLRERVGDDRLRPPTHVATDYYRSSLPHANYTTPAYDLNNTAVVDYDNEGYEYTKPSDLARYDLDHNRQLPHRRRESLDRSYHRPTVNVVSNDLGRYDTRGRGPPPASSGIDRYNRAAAAAAAGIYDRPTVTMPALPPVPAAPLVDPLRRIEAPREPSPDRKTARPRPVSLYQDTPARVSHPDELYRSHDDERLHRRRDRDDGYRDDDVTARGFGIRTNTLEPERSDRPARSVDRRDYDDRRQRRDGAEREPRRRSDESIDYTRSHDSRKTADDTVTRSSSVREPRDSASQKNGVGGRTRDKVAAGLGVAAAAVGLAARDAAKDDDRKVSPRRGDLDDDKDVASSRAADRYKPKDKDAERKPSARSESVAPDSRESRKEQVDPTSGSRDRELERERVRERAYERERERDLRELEKDREREKKRDLEREKDRELDRERERNGRDDKTRVNGSAAADSKDDSIISDDATAAPRRRRRNSTSFDPTDTDDLLDVKAELAAKEGQDKTKEKPATKESDKETTRSASVERLSTGSREESRGRESSTTEKEKQVRVVSPPREKSEQKPIKGILKPPSAKFPEEQNPIREGVAPHKDDKSKKGVPPGARWTKINRKLINPAALENGGERFEVRDDFVIVLRVLGKDEIQKYANDTAIIRAEKRKEYEKQYGSDRNYDSHREDRDYSDDERRVRRSRREHETESDYRRYRDREDDRDRHRRTHRHGSDSEDDARGRRAIEYDVPNGRHDARPHRSHREYDTVPASKVDDRR
ncbi:hypothetical protein F4774DRAFT_23876 [Daldinia eschscholtzii]|nr:hypothetical protein F4774DRAFT_23876 [Daldinia eschscholtzii]